MQRPGRRKGPDLPGSVGLLRRIIDQAAIGMALLGANGRLLYVNRAFRGLVGYTAAQCAELTLKDITHPDDRKKLRLKARGEDGIERRYVRRDGSPFHGLTSVSPLGKDSAGTPFRFILQIVDIEERKQAELALAEEEWRWDHALLGAGQGVWDIDIAKDQVWISPQWEKVLGIKSDTIAGYRAKWLARVHFEDRERMGQAMLALRNGSKSETNEAYRLQRADKKWVWVLSRGRVVKRAPDGTVLRIIGVTTDISRQKDTEAKLAQASERLGLALEAGGVGTYDIDIVAEKHLLDDQTLALFGIEKSRANGSPEIWKKAVHPDDLPGLWEKILADRASGVTSSQYDFRVVHRKPRAVRHIRSLTRLIRGLDGAALRLIGICWDVTDDIRRTEQLQDTLAQLGVTGERLEIALEAGSIGTFDADIETGVRKWDDRTFALHGVTRDEYDGSRQGFFALMHPDDRERVQDTLAALLTSGTTFFRIDYRVIHPKSGAIRHIRTMTKLVREANGVARRRVGVCWDVTDELEKARQLAAATERLELALEAGNIGIFDVDVPGDKRVLDDRTLAHYGLSKKEYDGSRDAWTKILHPDDRARVLQQITADRASGVALSQYDFRVVRRETGAVRHIRSITRQFSGENRRVQRVVGVSWDVTDHVESTAQLQAAMAQLASASERLNLALKAGNIGIFDTDIIADRHRLDDRALALFGIRPEDADETAATWASAVHPDDLPRIVQQYTSMVASRASSTQYDFRVVHRDTGAIRHIRSIARFIRDKEGTALRSIGATWDVTEETQRTTQLQEAMARLASTTERLELALEAGGIGVFDVDILTNRNTFDDRALAVHGLVRSEFDGSQEAWERTILPDDRERMRQEVAAARASGVSHAQYDHRIRHPESGAIRHIRSITRYMRGPTGTVTRGVGVVWDITDQVERTQQLQEALTQLGSTTERLELALEAGRVGTFDVDATTGLRHFDDQTMALHGLVRSEFDGTQEAWQRSLHPDDLPRMQSEIIANRASGKTAAQYDYRVVHKTSGAVRHISAVIRQIRDANGPIRRVVGVCWDVTDHIERNRKLSEALALLDAVMTSSPDLIFARDLDDRYIFINKSLETIIGRPEADIIGKAPADVFTPEVAAQLYAHGRQVMAEGAPLVFEETGLIGGAPRIYSAIKAPLHDEQGNIIGLLGISRDVTAIRAAEAALRQSEMRWQFAIDGAGDGIWDWDVKSGQVFFSRQLKAMLGYDEHEFGVTLDAWTERIHPDDLPRGLAAIDEHFSGRNPDYLFEHRLRAKDGSWRWILSRGKVMERDADGRPLRAIGTHTDITDRVEQTRKLSEILALLDAVMTSSPDIIYAKDLDSRYLLANKAFEALAGRPESEIVGRVPHEIASPEDAALFLAEDREVLAHGAPMVFDEMAWANGVLRTYSATKAPLRDEHGNIIGLLGISRDVTDIRAAEAALRHSEMRWQFALDGAGDGIWDWDIKSDRLFYSHQWKAMLGYDEDEVGTGPNEWSDRVHPDDLPLCEAIIDSHLRGERPDFFFEHRLKAKDGSWRWILSRGKTMERDADGRPLRVIGTHTDITDRVEQTQRLRETLALLDAVMTGTPDLIFAKDLAGRYLIANKSMEPVMRAPVADILGRTDTELLPSEFAAPLIANDRDVLMSGNVQTDEEIAVIGGAEHIWSSTKAPLRDENGNIIGLLGISRDVTEIKKAEAALRDTLELLNAVMSGTPDLIFVKDRECRYLVANHALEKVLGRTNAELRGKSTADMYPPEIADRLIANDRAIMASGEAHTIEEVVLVGGIAHTFLSTKAPRRDAQGNIIGVIGIARDVTEIKLAEAALWRAEMRWQFALDGSGDGIWDWNVQTGHVFFSRQWKAMLGHSDDELDPTVDEWSRRVHPEDLPGAWEIIERHMRGETADFALEHRMRAKDGSWRWILDRGKIMERTEDGKPLRMIGTHTDITTRKEAEAAILALHQRLQIAVEASGAGIFDGDMTKPEFHWGERMYELYDLPPGGYDGTLDQWLSFIHPDDVPRVLQKYDMALNETSIFSMDFRIRRQRSGEWRHIRSLAKILRDAPGLRAVGMNWDITDHKELAEALFEEKERLRITLHSIGDSVITTDANARIAFMNPVAEEMTGWPAADAAGRPLREIFRIVDEVTGAVIPDPVAACLALMRPYHLDDGAVLIGRDGERRNVRDSAAPVRTTSGEVIGAVLVFQDVTKARTMQQALEHSATHDSLTGLPNRAAFERSLREAREVASLKREHVLCFIDLDRFKIVNDGAGHAAGDALLREVANLLRRACRAEDVAARLGGDEFALLFRDCSIGDGEKLAQRFLKSLADLRFTWNDRAYQIGASMGLTSIGKDAPPTDELMSRADIACYTAKTAGRNQIAVYGGAGSPAHRHHREVQVAAGIRNAIETDRFRLYAQELLDLAPTKGNKGQKRQYEILLRMLDEKGAIMEPSGFIPASERYDLMGSIDRWVIRTTFRTYGERLRRTKDISVALNLSANSLNDPFLWPFLQEEFEASGLPPGQISFEITETAVINNLAAAKLFLSKARAAGCGVMLDDFGTGLSSFVYLRQFPVDGVKIDGGFIRQMTENPIDRAIVESINAIGHRLGAVTVAEQVEDEATLALVRAMGVDRAQGYAISYPEPFDNLF